jgi:ABC-2 type transport system permease protein
MNALQVIAAFLRRDWAIERSYRFSLVSGWVSQVLNLAMFFFISRLINQSQIEVISGFQGGYFSFVVVGIVLQSLSFTMLSSFAVKLRSEQSTGALEALLATPTPTPVVLLGNVSYNFVSAVINSVTLLIFASIIFGLEIRASLAAGFTALLITVACLVFFAAVGIGLAAFVVVYKQANAIISWAGTAIGLLGGVYYPLNVLPPPVRFLAELLPFTWALEAIRAALLDNEIQPVRLIGVIAAAVISLPVGLWVFRLGLAKARRDGSLAQY